MPIASQRDQEESSLKQIDSASKDGDEDHNKTAHHTLHIQEAECCQTSNCEEESYDKRV